MSGTGLSSILPLILIFAVVALFILFRTRRTGGSARPTYDVRAIPILSARELDFMRRLDEALGDIEIHVCPQVSFDAILRAHGNNADARESLRARYKQKRVDFALMNARAEVMLIVEVDDSSHDSPDALTKDAFRDDLMASAGIPTLRIPKGQLPTPPALKARLRSLHPELGVR